MARPSAVRLPETAQLLLPRCTWCLGRQRAERPQAGHCDGVELARVEHLRAGNRRRVECFAVDRRVPLGAARRRKFEHRLGQHVVHQAQRGLVAIVLALQVEVHRKHDQRRILGLPRCRLDRPAADTRTACAPSDCQPGVHAGGIGFEQRSLVGAGRRSTTAGPRRESDERARGDRLRARAGPTISASSPAELRRSKSI